MFILYTFFILIALLFIVGLPIGIVVVTIGVLEGWRREDAQAKLNDLELAERGYRVAMLSGKSHRIS